MASLAVVVAVDGPLSRSLSSRARSASAVDSSDPDELVAVELTLAVDPAVDVRFSGCRLVGGGLATVGLLVKAGLAANLRKSM